VSILVLEDSGSAVDRAKANVQDFEVLQGSISSAFILVAKWQRVTGENP
jgi:hypothetical protein